jgi:DNA-binding transcriptional ArsR family regulator
MKPSRPFSVQFAVTPRFDVFYSLYTLVSPGPTPLGVWKERALLRLPRDFERVARRVAPVPLFWPLLADVLQGLPGELSFDEMLSHLRALTPQALKENVLTGIFRDRAVVEGLLSRKKNLRQVLTDEKLPGGEMLRHFGLRPYTAVSHGTSAIATLLSEPESYRDELVLVLTRYWQTGFRRDWSELEPKLRASAFRMKELDEDGSFAKLARELDLPLAPDDRARELRPRRGEPLPYDRIDRCYIMPSAFNTGRWWARYEGREKRLSVYLPVPAADCSPNGLVQDETARPAAKKARDSHTIEPAAVFRALGDTTRYAIASILARTPTSTAELARRLRVSKPTITHHIQTLRAAGLIDKVAEGGSVKLSLNPEIIRQLSAASMGDLFSSTADLQLSTTRKRRN